MAFNNTNNCPIYVPAESVNAYKAASVWSNYASRIYAIPTPKFQGKWLATYSDSSTASAACDASSAITISDITKTDLVSVEIGDCVTTIGNIAFSGCTTISSCTIGSSVTSIDFSAFNRCSSLTSIEIPSGVTSIGNQAFLYCYGLTSVTVNAVTPPTLGNNAFTNTNGCPIYVPSESVNTYKEASGWSSYASRIQAIP
jgi:hypothetical protein